MDERQEQMWDDLYALVDAALEQFDAGMAVDLEKEYHAFIAKWLGKIDG